MAEEYVSKASVLAALEWRWAGKGAIDAVKAIPAADVVPVVRCRDCKYNSNPPECGNAVCDLFYGMTDQMGFCHHGERREQDETD